MGLKGFRETLSKAKAKTKAKKAEITRKANAAKKKVGNVRRKVKRSSKKSIKSYDEKTLDFEIKLAKANKLFE